jgi:hypothetical protein
LAKEVKDMAYNPYQYGGYYNTNPYQQFQQQTMSQQPFTAPTIHAEIIQVDDMQAAYNYPVGAGQTQMFMARDDSAFFIKSVLANSQTSFVIYDRRKQEQQKPESINMNDYITRTEFEQRLKEVAQHEPIRTTKQQRTAESAKSSSSLAAD